jgi:hypothetical protein
MKKQVRLLWVVLAAIIVAAGACKHKPAYSDIDANKTSRNQNQNGGTEATAAQPAPGESPAAPASQPSPAAPQRPSFQSPSFLDATRGEIKDLPSYPSAQRVNVQIGAVQGVNTATFVFTTRDPMDKITAFFDQAIKNNHWTVTDKMIDPELSEWTLEKAKDNSAKVRATKDQTGRINIIIIRGEKLQEPGK